MTKTDNITESVAALAAKLLSAKKRLISVESCTGGGLAYHCTMLPGSSEWFYNGYVCYHNKAKISLGVPPNILARYGAVSEQTAAAMVEAAQQKIRVGNDGKVPEQQANRVEDFLVVSITGIAGPAGATSDKPVGTCCFGFSDDHNIIKHTKVFDGGRDAIRQAAIAHTLSFAADILTK